MMPEQFIYYALKIEIIKEISIAQGLFTWGKNFVIIKTKKNEIEESIKATKLLKE